MIATHARSWDRGRQIEEPKHIEDLVAHKRQAREHRGIDRLFHAVPASQAYFAEIAHRGGNLGANTPKPVVDEVGYLSYDTRHADLFFEVVTRRYEQRSTVVTTNKPFAEWNTIFPSAACVVTLVDRLIHRAEILPIEGESYRLKEATERAQRKKTRTERKKQATKG